MLVTIGFCIISNLVPSAEFTLRTISMTLRFSRRVGDFKGKTIVANFMLLSWYLYECQESQLPGEIRARYLSSACQTHYWWSDPIRPALIREWNLNFIFLLHWSIRIWSGGGGGGVAQKISSVYVCAFRVYFAFPLPRWLLRLHCGMSTKLRHWCTVSETVIKGGNIWPSPSNPDCEQGRTTLITWLI
jgi:hypothetical protein